MAGEPGAAAAAIHTIALGKRYRHVVALAGLTMTVPRGEIFGFLGPNGAGKTTAVKLLLGLVHPTSGEAWLLGAPAGDRLTRRRIGYLPELFRYQDWLTAQEVLTLHAELAGLPKGSHLAEITRVLDTVGLSTRARDRVGTFSKGMQQRLGLGVALLGQPELVLLDEPTSALDPVGRHDIREIIRSLRQQGTTVFLNSHLLSEVEQVCDRVAIIDQGSVIALGTMDAVIGGTKSVRLRLGNVTDKIVSMFARFGSVEVEHDWYIIHDIDLDVVPTLVADIVRLGGRVFAVEPRHQTLEDRFLELLGGDRHAAADHRSPDHP